MDYTGIRFPFSPKAVCIVGYSSSGADAYGPALIIQGAKASIFPNWYTDGCPGTEYRQVSRYSMTVTLSGRTCRWIGADSGGQLNKSEFTYYHLAIG